jgi:hypothetical protein
VLLALRAIKVGIPIHSSAGIGQRSSNTRTAKYLRRSLGATVLATTPVGPHDNGPVAIGRLIGYGTGIDGHYLATDGFSNKKPEASAVMKN